LGIGGTGGHACSFRNDPEEESRGVRGVVGVVANVALVGVVAFVELELVGTSVRRVSAVNSSALNASSTRRPSASSVAISARSSAAVRVRPSSSSSASSLSRDMDVDVVCEVDVGSERAG
jgi:hypothetical protein